MPLKVIGAGFGRTGTWSTKEALNRLGFPCYHMSEVILNKANANHLDFWRDVSRSPAGSQHDWEKVFAKYSAAIDNPACCVWRELLVAYPDAKVLLTVHPGGAESWWASVMETIYFTENTWQFKVLQLLTPWGRKFGEMSNKLIWGRALKGVMNEKANAAARYNAYVDEVKAAVPPDKLLIFSVDQGWGPLCRFLGVPEPNGPFPNLNDRASFEKTRNGVLIGAYLTLAGYIGAAVVLMFLVWRFVL